MPSTQSPTIGIKLLAILLILPTVLVLPTFLAVHSQVDLTALDYLLITIGVLGSLIAGVGLLTMQPWGWWAAVVYFGFSIFESILALSGVLSTPIVRSNRGMALISLVVVSFLLLYVKGRREQYAVSS